MSHALMSGMFWAGVLLSVIPVLACIGFGLFIWRQTRNERKQLDVSAAEEVPT